MAGEYGGAQPADGDGVISLMRAGLAAVLAFGLVAAPAVAGAQQAVRIPSVGFLSAFSPADVPFWREGFRRGLRDLGYVEGHNIAVEYLYAEGVPERLPGLAAELIRRKMDIIVVETTPASLAAKQATTTIPIVMTIAADPVRSGLVSNLARPGGNITGLSLQLPEVTAKRLQLLREIIPSVSRVAILWNLHSPITQSQLKAAEAAASKLGISVETLGVRGADDFEKALHAARRRGAGALLVLDDFLITRYIQQIAVLTAKAGLPAMAGITGFGEAGGLISYGPNFPAISRRAATYVDRILKGAKPGDLAIEQPTNFELVINLKTAKALGLTVPPSLLLRTDRVIE